MKFILNEKYILNEKHILNERFILTEAEIDSKTCVLAIKNIVEKFNNGQFTVAKLEKIIAELEALKQDTKGAAFLKQVSDLWKKYPNLQTKAAFDRISVNTIKQNINDFLNELDKLLDIANIKTKFPDINTAAVKQITEYIKDLREAAGDGPNSVEYEQQHKNTSATAAKGAIENGSVQAITNNDDDKTKRKGKEYLFKLLQGLKDSLNNLFNNVSPEDIDELITIIKNIIIYNKICIIKDTEGPKEPFLNKVNKAQQKVSTDRREQYYNILNNDWYIEALNNETLVLKNIKLPVKFSNIANLKKAYLKVKQTTEKAIADLRKLMKEDSSLDDTINNFKDELPWAEAFKQVISGNSFTMPNGKVFKSREVLWDYYYEVEWPGYDKQKLSSLGEAFVIECNKLGFTEQHNPFITFLKTDGVLENINGAAYAGIHNSYISKYITNDDLRRKNDAIKYNIIYNKSLYKLSSGEVEAYLKLQSDTFKNLNDSVQNIAFAALQTRYQKTPLQASIDLFTSNPIIKDAEYKPGSNTLPLNYFDRCEHIYETLFGKKAEKEKEEFKLTNDLKNKISSNHEFGIQLINLIIINFSKDRTAAEIKAITDKFTGYKKDLQFTDAITATEYRQLLDKNFDMEKDFNKAIMAIAETAELIKKEEK